MKTQIFKHLLLTTTLLMFVNFGFATEKFFEVSGWVKKGEEEVKKAEVEVYSGDTLLGVAKTNRWGNFNIELELNKDYVLVIKNKGNADKKVLFHTSNTEKGSEDIYFEFIVDLLDENTEEETKYFYHMLVYDETNNDFMYLQPNMSEFLNNQNDPDFNNSVINSDLINQD